MRFVNGVLEKPLEFDIVFDSIYDDSFADKLVIPLIVLKPEIPNETTGVCQEHSPKLYWCIHKHTILVNSLIYVNSSILFSNQWVILCIVSSKLDISYVPIEVLSDVWELFGIIHFQGVVQ